MWYQVLFVTVVLCVGVHHGDGKERRGLSLLKSSDEKRREFNQTYPGCWLGDHFYMVGDKWSPEIEPYGVMKCVKCQCAQVVKQSVVQLEGKVLCRNIKSDCPKVTCRHPRLRPRTCCKICNEGDALFEDQFSQTNPGLVPTTSSTPSDVWRHQGLSALLTGSPQRSKQPIKTNAVSWIRIVPSTGNGFKYYIRFSRLKNPFALRFQDKGGSVLMEVKLSTGRKRKGMIHGAVSGVRYKTFEAITQGRVWCSIHTLRYKDGEISGPLVINDINTPALFEAVLSPKVKNGLGGVMSIYYDSMTSHASYVIQIQDHGDSSDRSDFFVTFEKDTDIIYQHLLHKSNTENKLMGQFKLDRKLSRQLARGRIQGRVTSRTGETITGVIRPRLVRSDIMVPIFVKANNISGVFVGRIEESGTFSYKISLEGAKDVQYITLQSMMENSGKWKTSMKLRHQQWKSTHNQHGALTISGTYKKLKVEVVAAILDMKLRLHLLVDEVMVLGQVERVSLNTVDVLKDSSLTIRSPFCDDIVYVWYRTTPDCTLNVYLKNLHGASKQGEITAVFKTQFDPVYGEDMYEFKLSRDQPEVSLVNISAAVFRDLDAGQAYLYVKRENPTCDKWRGTIRIPNGCWRLPLTDSVSSHTALNELEKDPDLELMYTCHYEGKFYPHGSSWVPELNSACVTCRCERGTTHCDDVLCPSPNCARQVIREGECCPVCEDDNETEKKPIGSCFYQGDKRWHLFGTIWHPYVPPFGYSKCSVCTCMPETGGVNCSRLACPGLDCPTSQRVRVNRDDCCQTCQEVSPTSMVHVPSRSHSKDDCNFGTGTYRHGDKWHPVLTPFGTMTCYICSCKSGKIRCRKKKCPVLRCKRHYRPTGQCCPVCKGKTSISRRKHRRERSSFYKLDISSDETS